MGARLKAVVAFALLALAVLPAGAVKAPPGTAWGNATPAETFPTFAAISALIDQAISQAPGALLCRNATQWVVIGSAASGVLTAGGVGSCPTYQPSIAGLTGDCTTAGSVITCTKTNGVAFGSMSAQAASAVAITGGTITGMGTPSNSADVAPKSYVDAVAAGIAVHTSVAWATAAVLPNTPTYANGAAGVGATLTAGSNAAIAVDGGAPALNDRVLVKNQASGFQNGVYTVTTVGDGATPWVLTRATDFDQAAVGEIATNAYFFTTSGAANIGAGYVLTTTGAITVGVTSLTFTQFSGGGGSSGAAGGDLTGFYPNPTLAVVNANVGAFGSATQCVAVTVNAKGLITAASQRACVSLGNVATLFGAL